MVSTCFEVVGGGGALQCIFYCEPGSLEKKENVKCFSKALVLNMGPLIYKSIVGISLLFLYVGTIAEAFLLN